MSRCNAHYDLGFERANKVYLFECKCFHFRNRGGATVELRKRQVVPLGKMKKSLCGDINIFVVIAIRFDPSDIVVWIMPLEKALQFSRKFGKAGRRWLKLSTIMRSKTFRLWLAEEFDVPWQSIAFPDFTTYLPKVKPVDKSH